MLKKKRRLPYFCPVCKTEMTQAVYNSDLKEFGRVICSVCKESEMQLKQKKGGNTHE